MTNDDVETVCEMDGCQDNATHTVLIVSGNGEETWKVCRPHDRELKRAFVGGVPQSVPPPDAAAIVQCGECGQVLADASPPCSRCGSLNRAITVGDTVTMHEAARVCSKHPGKSGWLLDVKAGDCFTKDLNAWSHRELVLDREHDRYREVIELYEGSRLESTAKLCDHQG